MPFFVSPAFAAAPVRALAAGAALVLLSACAATPHDGTAKPDSATAVTCTNEAPLGSSIGRRTCHAPMTEEERAAVARDINLRDQQKPIIGK